MRRGLQLPVGVYFPFGAGPRICNAQAYAMAEASITVATVVEHLHVRGAHRTVGPMTLNGSLPPEDMSLLVTPRY